MLVQVAFLVAFICFLLSTAGVTARMNLSSLGLLFLTLALYFRG